MEFDLDFDFDGINLDIDIFGDKTKIKGNFLSENSVFRIPFENNIDERLCKYDNAQKLAKEIGDIKINERINVLLSGNFIFGDFLEAWIVENNWHVKKMTISTLSLSKENVDSLDNLLKGEYVDEMSMIVSRYFYGHEKHNLILYIEEYLGKDEHFNNFAISDVHTKIFLFELYSGEKIIIHGSANMRSSANIEYMEIEENKNLYDFHLEWHENIINKYNIKKKPLSGRAAVWQTVIMQEKVKAK